MQNPMFMIEPVGNKRFFFLKQGLGGGLRRDGLWEWKGRRTGWNGGRRIVG